MRVTLRAGLAIALIAALPGGARAQQAAGNPHGRLPAGNDCTACHTQRSWRPLKRTLDFDHNASTKFMLLGRHEKASCGSCHLDLRFDMPRLSEADCASCHVDVHQGRFVAGCPACHNATSFNDVAGMTLHSRTSFPLTGAHMQISCESCHRDDVAGAYTSLNTDCIACHASDFAAAASIDHVANGFPTNCDGCHGNLSWGGGTMFDHVTASGGFALLGAHGRLDCSMCHALPGMQLAVPTPSGQNDCIACHQADYDREHTGSSFPVTCSNCHSVSTWSGATFNHSQWFPIAAGPHSSARDCATCHVQPGDYRVFTCFNCHEHSQDRMDARHDEEPRYVYDSNACYSCHPNGRS